MTRKERELTIRYLTEIQERYIEGEGHERYLLPEHVALEIAIEALKEESILDKIRADIKDNRDEWIKGQDAEWHTYNRCLQIIDKYKAESEMEP